MLVAEHLSEQTSVTVGKALKDPKCLAPCCFAARVPWFPDLPWTWALKMVTESSALPVSHHPRNSSAQSRKHHKAIPSE